MLVQYKSSKVLKETHVEARQGHFIDMSVTVRFPAVNVAPVPVQMKQYTSEAKSFVITSHLPLPHTTQLYQMQGYFAVKGHNFGHFQQPNLEDL